MSPTSSVLLVRHATCAQTASVLMGRMLDPPLDAAGARQARALGVLFESDRTLGGRAPPVIHSSPRRRTLETAAAIAAAVHADVVTAAELDELDFGSWSGRSFDELATEPDWVRWNRQRALARTPAGDTMQAAQARVLEYISTCTAGGPTAPLVLVTHAEPIRAVLLHFLGHGLGEYHRLRIDPASRSRIDFDGTAVTVRIE